jgi:acyl-CoA synthetase (AMP-forming)/AMP-acid ligase II
MLETTALNLIDMLDRGAPDAAALLAPGRDPMTFGALREDVLRLAGRLAVLGFGRNDRIAIVMENGPDLVRVLLATASCATAVPLNPKYRPDEFRFYYGDSSAKGLIVAPGAFPDALAAVAPGMTVIHAIADSSGGLRLDPVGPARPARSLETPGPEDVAILLHTSGTTKQPKRVPIRHRNLAASAANVARTYGLTPEDVSLCVMPLFHIHGICASLLAPLSAGGAVVSPPPFDALRFWGWVEAFRPTWYSAVPSMHQMLLARAGRNRDIIRKNPFRFIRSCSSSLAPTVLAQMEEAFDAPVLEAYGMTEASHQMTSNPLPPGVRKPGTVGVGQGVEVSIMDESGTLLPPGLIGEIVVRGPNIVDGYENNPEANAAAFTHGWFRTGDEGLMDGDGYLTITGRLSERINRGGEKISPLEIDHVLLRHPAVGEALAFGVPHPTLGEDIHAAVVLKSPATEQELRRHCAALVADFKVPARIHFMESLPYVGTGKLRRNVMAKALALAG